MESPSVPVPRIPQEVRAPSLGPPVLPRTRAAVPPSEPAESAVLDLLPSLRAPQSPVAVLLREPSSDWRHWHTRSGAQRERTPREPTPPAARPASLCHAAIGC